MKSGILYGIGVGPGDPELMTLKGARVLERCKHVFVPKAKSDNGSIALGIAGRYLGPGCLVHELVFPMSGDTGELSLHWSEAARSVAEVVKTGEDACFLTLGDPFLYSTYIYLVRALREQLPGVEAITIPGITAFSAAAALAEFPVGEGRGRVVIVPASDDLDAVRQALAAGGTVILMKVGKRLGAVLEIIEKAGLLDRAVYVSKAGLDGQEVETDLRKLLRERTEADYLSIVLVHAGG
ncbi:MAG: precorrin-2 C(20)-methyltransferase [Syntrophobacteraceae bacterium]|nr:precorrin-2 C(20)-methyltransferase [Syntrophobacteraceae bacterium]